MEHLNVLYKICIPMVKSYEKEIAEEVKETDVEVNKLKLNVAEQAAKEKAAAQTEEQAAKKTDTQINFEENQGYFILGNILGSGGSFKTPYKLYFGRRGTYTTPIYT